MAESSSDTIPPTQRVPYSGAPEQRFLALVERHYAPLYRLALARLGEADAAHQSIVRTLAAAWGQLSQHPAQAGETWLYALALRQAPRRPGAALQDSFPAGEAPFWKAVAALDEQEHLLLALRYLLGWPAAPAASLLRVGEGAVKAQLRLFRSQLAHLLPGEGTVPAEAAADEAMQAALQRRYPAPLVMAGRFEEIAGQAQRLVERPAPTTSPPALSARPAWLLVTGGVMLVVLCALAGLTGWGLAASGLLQEGLGTAPRVAPGSNLPTPITPAPRLAELSRRSGTAEILQRWQDSPGLWHTLSIDVQSADYGPLSYIGPPRQYRLTVWISQPGEAFEVFGLLSNTPTQVLLTAGNQQYRRDLLNGNTTHLQWDGYAVTQLSQPRLRWMVYPSSSPWAQREGSFRTVQTSTQLERTVVIYDWLNLDGQREARLWLDAQTGMILHLQEYGGPAFATLRHESTATYISVDAAAPPAALSAAARADQPPRPVDDFQDLLPTPTPAAVLSARPTLAPEPAPANFDPQGTRLTFALAQEAGPIDDYAQGPTNVFDLYADGYWLNRLRFGLPWGMRCLRSPNGLYLAFNNASDGAFPADETLRWLDLRQARRVYQTEFRLAASAFAFSPQTDHLAAFSQTGYEDQPGGIYLVDVITGDVRLLLEAERAESLAWSPDGEYIAFNGRLPDDEAASLIVVHVRTGTLNYQSQPGEAVDVAFNESPVLLWGIEFPVVLGGMDSCAVP